MTIILLHSKSFRNDAFTVNPPSPTGEAEGNNGYDDITQNGTILSKANFNVLEGKGIIHFALAPSVGIQVNH